MFGGQKGQPLSASATLMEPVVCGSNTERARLRMYRGARPDPHPGLPHLVGIIYVYHLIAVHFVPRPTDGRPARA